MSVARPATSAHPASSIDVAIHVDAEFPPFSYMQNGSLTGIVMAIARELFARIDGYNVRFVPIPWNRGKRIMQQGAGFALVPAYFHGHDWPYLYPYSQPLYTETVIAVCRDGVLPRNKKHRWPASYEGLRIGTVAGYDGWRDTNLLAYIKAGKIAYGEGRNTTAVVLMLVRERFDCITIEQTAFEYAVDQLVTRGQYIEGVHPKLVRGATISTDPVYIGYSRDAQLSGMYPFALDFRQRVDAALYTMHKTGELEGIVRRYLEQLAPSERWGERVADTLCTRTAVLAHCGRQQ